MDDFEKACSEIEGDEDYSAPCENAIEFLKGAKEATVTFTQGRYITKIRKLAERFPDKVKIYSDKDGTLVAHIPTSAIKISLSEPRSMTEEARARGIEALRQWREEQKSLGDR